MFMVITRFINYVKASTEELKKVTWPTKKEVYKYSTLVIAVSLGLAVFLGGLDKIFSWLFQLIM
jgi:preprotein translocase subunit SecE